MLQRTVFRPVHLFNSLLPTNMVKAPALVTDERLTVMRAALDEASPFLSKSVSVLPALELCKDVTGANHRKIVSLFDEYITSLRSELANRNVTDPFHRMQLHEAIMAAGFYQRAANPNVLHGEGTRFVLNHFNFDVRRDTAITTAVHGSLLTNRSATPQSEKLLSDLLQLERRLFGHYRFAPTGGKRWFCLGVCFDDVKTEEEVVRLLDLAPVKKDGNIGMSIEDNEKELWKTVSVSPKKEETLSFLEARDLHKTLRDVDVSVQLRINKPPKPLDFWERLREKLLRYWVIWLTCWLMFFMVDEEIIALVSLIILKYKSMRIMEAEAEKTGGKVYVARARA